MAQTKEERAEKARAYYAANADAIRARVKAYRDANIEKVREYDRKRGYRATKEGQDARNAARTVPLQPCAVCGSEENLEKHHPDYSKPKEVVSLCRKHHRELHRKVA